MNKSDSIKELAIAMNKAQAEMQKAHKKSENPYFNSSYANLSEVLTCVKEAFTANGLSFTQMPSFENGIAYVETMVMHISGEWMSSISGSPLSKPSPQGIGDATTYLRRYSLAAVAGLAQADDDGNSNSSDAPKPSKKDQPVNWYQDAQFQQEKESITKAIKDGMPPSAVIKNLQEQGFTINKKIRSEIESI